MEKTLIKEAMENKMWCGLYSEGENTVWVEWNPHPEHVWMSCSEWLRKVSDNPLVCTTLTQWDELDNAIRILGGVKMEKTESYISDWGDGDTDLFVKSYFKFNIL